MKKKYSKRFKKIIDLKDSKKPITIDEAISRLEEFEKGPGVTAAVSDREFVNETYGLSFTAPAGWDLIDQYEDAYYLYDSYTGTYFTIEIDPTTDEFASGSEWANFWYEQGLVGLDNYELLSSEFEEDLDGIETYNYIESYEFDGVEYTTIQSFSYQPLSYSSRIYIEMPTLVYSEAWPRVVKILDSVTDLKVESGLSGGSRTMTDPSGTFSIQVPDEWESLETADEPGLKMWVGRPHLDFHAPNLQVIKMDSDLFGDMRITDILNLYVSGDEVIYTGEMYLGSTYAEYAVSDSEEHAFHTVVFKQDSFAGDRWSMLCTMRSSSDEAFLSDLSECESVTASFRFAE